MLSVIVVPSVVLSSVVAGVDSYVVPSVVVDSRFVVPSVVCVPGLVAGSVPLFLSSLPPGGVPPLQSLGGYTDSG